MVENVFGIAANKWRIWRKPIDGELKLIVNIIKGVVVLHNFCREEVPNQYYLGTTTAGSKFHQKPSENDDEIIEDDRENCTVRPEQITTNIAGSYLSNEQSRDRGVQQRNLLSRYS